MYIGFQHLVDIYITICCLPAGTMLLEIPACTNKVDELHAAGSYLNNIDRYILLNIMFMCLKDLYTLYRPWMFQQSIDLSKPKEKHMTVLMLVHVKFHTIVTKSL